MKTFSLFALMSLGIIFTVNAQEKSYTPNARQAVQNSRMQQPQYMDNTNPAKVKVELDQKQVEINNTAKAVNYQVVRPVAIDIDAPKRRSKKRVSTFATLASNSKN